ncbi:hypothetical protein [Paraburkholderia agricolaris]|uniref:hypothetical protein n=1 Tax=Paraburkholderia agricolaris TaxID=2152888 RepID=UPI0015810579|nr:hypothetical protein [Paraburkholderia agricolaris]
MVPVAHGDLRRLRDPGELIASSMMMTLTAKISHSDGFLAGAVLAALACAIALRMRRLESRRADKVIRSQLQQSI